MLALKYDIRGTEPELILQRSLYPSDLIESILQQVCTGMWVASKPVWISSEMRNKPEETLILGYSLVSGLKIT